MSVEFLLTMAWMRRAFAGSFLAFGARLAVTDR